MGAMNATGHLLCVVASGSIEKLWDFAAELCERRALGGAPGVHGFTPQEIAEGAERGVELGRWCFHPTSAPDVEFRGDDLREVLVAGCTWLAQQLDQDDVWRREA